MRLPTVVAVISALLLVGCGDDDGPTLDSLYDFRGGDCGTLTEESSASDLEAANMRRIGHTDEGDEITTAFQVIERQSFDYIVDSRSDEYGESGVFIRECDALDDAVERPDPDFESCAGERRIDSE